MALGGDKLGHGVCECRVRADMEYRKGITTPLDAALGQNHRDEVHASVFEEREARRADEKPDIGGGDVTDHVQSVVDHGNRAKALIVHQSQGIGEGSIGAVGLVS